MGGGRIDQRSVISIADDPAKPSRPHPAQSARRAAGANPGGIGGRVDFMCSTWRRGAIRWAGGPATATRIHAAIAPDRHPGGVRALAGRHSLESRGCRGGRAARAAAGRTATATAGPGRAATAAAEAGTNNDTRTEDGRAARDTDNDTGGARTGSRGANGYARARANTSRARDGAGNSTIRAGAGSHGANGYARDRSDTARAIAATGDRTGHTRAGLHRPGGCGHAHHAGRAIARAAATSAADCGNAARTAGRHTSARFGRYPGATGAGQIAAGAGNLPDFVFRADNGSFGGRPREAGRNRGAAQVVAGSSRAARRLRQRTGGRDGTGAAALLVPGNLGTQIPGRAGRAEHPYGCARAGRRNGDRAAGQGRRDNTAFLTGHRDAGPTTRMTMRETE